MTHNHDYITQSYRTEWNDCVNIVIMLYEEPAGKQIGIIEVRAFRGDSPHNGEALLWNLTIDKAHRRKGLGQRLLHEAEEAARCEGSTVAVLEWSLHDSPRWVAFWYARQGYDEKEFSNVYTLMKKEL